MTAWANGWTDRPMNRRKDGWICELIVGGRMDEWVDGWTMDGWMAEWVWEKMDG